MSVPDQTSVDVRQRRPVRPAAAINGRQIIKAGFLLGGCPRGFVESIVCFVRLALIQQGQAQSHHCFAVVGVGVALGHALDGLAEIHFAPGKQTTAQQQTAIGIVHTAVAGIPLERLQVIRVRQIRGMAVLLNVQTGQIQFLVGMDLVGQLCRRCRIVNLLDVLLLRCVIQQFAAVAIVYRQHQFRFRHMDRHGVPQHLYRADGLRAIVNGLTCCGQYHPCIFVHAGGVYGDACLPAVGFQIQHRFGAGILDVTCRLVWHEVLREGLFLKRLEPAEVRLIVAEHTGHQLDVRPVGIGEVPVPCPAEVAAAPRPLLLAG